MKKSSVFITLIASIFLTAIITQNLTSKYFYKTYSKELTQNNKSTEISVNKPNDESNSNTNVENINNDKSIETKGGFKMSNETIENEKRKDKELIEYSNSIEGKEYFLEELYFFYLQCCNASAELTTTFNYFVLPDEDGMYLQHVINGAKKLNTMSDSFYQSAKMLKYKKDQEIPSGNYKYFNDFFKLYKDFITNFNKSYTLNKGNIDNRISLYSMNETNMEKCSNLINNDMHKLLEEIKNNLGIKKDVLTKVINEQNKLK